jgi:hypothetical protein
MCPNNLHRPPLPAPTTKPHHYQHISGGVKGWGGVVIYLWCTMHFKMPQNMTPQSHTNKEGKTNPKKKEKERGFFMMNTLVGSTFDP